MIQNKLIKVTKDNYFEDTGHMSTSRFKRFLSCELDGCRNPTFNSTALLVGSYVDSWLDGTLDEFIEDNPEIISSRGPTKGQLKSEFKKADEVIEFIKQDNVLQQFFSGTKQDIWTGEIGGVPYKSMTDAYSKGIAINDLKVLRSVTNRSGEYYDFITQWGYQYQGSIYQELVFQNTGERLPFYLCVVTKENPINSVIVNIDQHILDLALEEVMEHSQRFYDLMQGNAFPKGCGICNTCISNRRETPIISMEDIIKSEEF